VQFLDIGMIVSFGDHAHDHPPLLRDPEALPGAESLERGGIGRGPPVCRQSPPGLGRAIAEHD
jgi:hypothetical protein